MNNLLTTVPKSRFRNLAEAEETLRRCDGETDWGEELGSEWLWFIRAMRPPAKKLDDSVCFLVFDGKVIGYFHIIESCPAKKWIDKGYILAEKASAHVVVLANYVSLPPSERIDMKGFQGWRYTQLRP